MSDVPKKTEIDPKVVSFLIKKIVFAENANLRTKNRTDGQMVSDIKKLIEESVSCC